MKRGTLQLADNATAQDYWNSLAQAAPNPEYYIFVPTDGGAGNEGKWVREDVFDDLPDAEWFATMEALEFYNAPPHMAGIFSKWKENRAARRERRQTRKDLKAESKATARIQRSEGGGLVNKVIEGAKSIFGGTQVDAGFDVATGQTPQGYFRADTQPFYTKPAFIIGAVVVVAGGAYLLTRKK